MNRSLKTVVVGLGRVGSRFDEEPGRKVVWTHVGAYLAHAETFELVGACEPDAENATRFTARCPGVPVFGDLDALLAATSPDVASICTPIASHRAVLSALLDRPSIKAIWCEKPLADRLDDAESMIAGAAARGVPMVVSHVRRWVPLWRRVKALIDSGAVGSLRCVRVAMPNRLWSVGSHAVDLALFLGGRITDLKSSDIAALHQEGEPARAALLQFASGAYGIVQVTGTRENLMVEAEVIGDAGRVWAREDAGEIRIERFAPSPHYKGYRQLADAAVETHAALTDASPFVAIAAELAELARGARQTATCDGPAALAVQRALGQMAGPDSVGVRVA
jgi:predicted dehydrogenase